MWPAGLMSSTMAVAVLTLSACQADGLAGAVVEPEGRGQIVLQNASSREAWYAYTRRCGVTVWGEDELGPRLVLRPGQSAAWTETAGCYDLLLLTNPRVEPRYEARYERRQVVADRETSIAIAEDDWGPSVAAPAPAPGPLP
jgi:hypothetical protein